MIVTIYKSETVTIGSPAYRQAMIKAQTIASQQRAVGKGGLDRWEDDYNDSRASGRFVVTARS